MARAALRNAHDACIVGDQTAVAYEFDAGWASAVVQGGSAATIEDLIAKMP